MYSATKEGNNDERMASSILDFFISLSKQYLKIKLIYLCFIYYKL